MAPIRPLAWEPPYAVGSGPRKDKKKKKKKKNRKFAFLMLIVGFDINEIQRTIMEA